MRKGCRYEGGKEVRQKEYAEAGQCDDLWELPIFQYVQGLVDEETSIRDEWWKVIAKQRPAHEEHTSVHCEE